MPAAIGFGTPRYNMGSNLQEASLDTLTFTNHSLPPGSIASLLTYLERRYGDAFVLMEHGCIRGRWYEHYCRSVRGAELTYSKSEAGAPVSARLHLPGQFLKAAPQSFTFELSSMLYSAGWKCSRADLAFDDYQRIIEPSFIYSECDAGHLIRYRRNKVKYYAGLDGGATVRIGSPESNVLIRIYDKNAESKGEYNCIRWEGQLRDEKADVVIKELLNIGEYTRENYARKVVDLLMGLLDFRDDDDSNRNRCSQCAWWSCFLEIIQATPLKVPAPRPKPTLEKTVKWMGHQVETSLAMLDAVMAHRPGMFEQYILERVASGRERMNDMQHKIVKLHRDAIENIEFTLKRMQRDTLKLCNS